MSEVESCPKKQTVDSLDYKNVLNDFDFVKILNEDSMSKSIFIQAKKKLNLQKTENKENEISHHAVIIFSKSHFTMEETKSFLEVNNSLEIHIDNDVYKKLSIYPTKPYNSKHFDFAYLDLFESKIFFFTAIRCASSAYLSSNRRTYREVFKARSISS